ncbi:MAG: pyruvate kinase [Clostridiales bacterium]|nr:pyruvate kinase [Clostridiales bacterium]
MRKTKIIGTIGPASMDYAVMKKLVLAGLNIVRINLSHAKLEDMNLIAKNVNRLRKELGVPLPIMIDTRGPELRVGTFEKGQVDIKKGQEFVFTANKLEGNDTHVSINIPNILKSIKPNHKILACNGLLEFKVIEVNGKSIVTKAMNSGVLSNRKSLFVPGVKIETPYLNEADKKDILWGIENDVELIAASFVNSKQDVEILRNFITKNKGHMKIISKIESQCGVDNLDEIIDSTDAVMVARGDLGVEVAMKRLPELQKRIIKSAVAKGKAVITATEMLESMIVNNRPTRAEVTDIANAVYDGTSCVMLSGETASGKYPVEAVKTMSEVAEETERFLHPNDYCRGCSIRTISDVVSQSAVSATLVQDISAIVSFTNTGLSAGLISRFRPQTTIIGATPNEITFRQMELLWGVVPVLTPIYNTTDEMFNIANTIVKKGGFAKAKETIVITCGTPKHEGGTNLIKIVEVK